MEKKLLIIDDNYSSLQNRGEVYCSVLEDKYTIESIGKGSELIDKIDKTIPDLYIVDIVLDNMIDPITGGKVSSINVLRSLKKGIPILLVSSEYERMAKEGKLPVFLTELVNEGVLIKGFLIWSQFIEASINNNEDTRKIIQTTIDYYIALSEKDRLRSLKVEEIIHEVKFGVIAALNEELTPFLANVEGDIFTENYSHITFIFGKLKLDTGNSVGFVCASQDRMGMVDSAILGTMMIDKFNLSSLFMIGVCGGRGNIGVKIGDLLIPEESITYQGGKITNEKFILNSYDSQISSGLIQILNANQSRVSDILVKIFSDYQSIHLKNNNEFEAVKVPTIWHKPIACGDIIISKEGLLSEISKEHAKKDLCGVEMESYAVLRLNYYFNRTKVSVLKAVMDDTEYKSDKHKTFAAYISANFLSQIIKSEIIKFI